MRFRHILAAAAALGIWLALAAGLTAAAEPATTVAVFGPSASALSAMAAAEARLVDAGAGFIRVTSSNPGFVARLHAGGAMLVLPARSGGCIRLAAAARAAAPIPGP